GGSGGSEFGWARDLLPDERDSSCGGCTSSACSARVARRKGQARQALGPSDFVWRPSPFESDKDGNYCLRASRQAGNGMSVREVLLLLPVARGCSAVRGWLVLLPGLPGSVRNASRGIRRAAPHVAFPDFEIAPVNRKGNPG